MSTRFRRAAGLLAGCLLIAGPMAGEGQAAPVTATIDGSQTFQKIDGFGASEFFGQASSLMGLAAPARTQALDLLYSPVSGAGLTILRNGIGDASGSSIEPTSPGGPDKPPQYVPLSSINQDGQQLTLAQTIRQNYGVTNVFADAWSAPAYMKNNNSVSNGGQVCGMPNSTPCATGDWRQAYANYLVQYAKDYANAGVPLSYIGFENESNLKTTYDSMVVDGPQSADFIHYLGPTLAASGLPTKLECCVNEGWNFAVAFSKAVEEDPVADFYTPLWTTHSYPGDGGGVVLSQPIPGWTKPAWETEWSTFDAWDPAWDDGSDASGMSWAENIYDGLTKVGFSAYLYWWGSSTPAMNHDNESLILISPGAGPGASVTDSGRLWAFANYSRFIHPGATRIGAAVSDNNVLLSAYRNADGTLAVVAINKNRAATPVTFSVGNTVPDGTLVVPYVTDANTAAQSTVDSNTSATTGVSTQGQQAGACVPAPNGTTCEGAPPTDKVAPQPTTAVNGGKFSASLPGRSLVTFVLGYHNG